MNVSLQPILSDVYLDIRQSTHQRQLSLSVAALSEGRDGEIPLNLCLILDRSGSMKGKPLSTVKEAAKAIVDRMSPVDRLTIVAFNHQSQLLVPNQEVGDRERIKAQIDGLEAGGGTAIDTAMKQGLEALTHSSGEFISQAFLLTDGENEHGNNDRCLKLALVAINHSITINTFGFGNNWNQDVLEKIADAGGGSLSYIEQPAQAEQEFSRLFQRMQSVGLTNAYLRLWLAPEVRLAELKPVAQVSPDTIELAVQDERDYLMVRLGDLMVDVPRVVLVNLYIGQLAEGTHPIADVCVRYDDPTTGQNNQLSPSIPIVACAVRDFQPAPNPQVQKHVLTLAKYRQTQIAETRLQEGDRQGAVTMLQSAANTALLMGDERAATVLQENATRLQQGEDLSAGDRKKTRLVAKTTLQF
jgi:Ca-activated chloride channel homolog